ncbi:MAG: ABC transporter permease [Gammaproteobacteria bacterium]|nr:ABC transporter permease [Gammaproteobacteria bacterium]
MRASLGRMGALVAKELRQLRRDRVTFAMIIGIPAIQLILFGFAINFDVRHLPAAVADLANTSASRELVQDLSQTQVLVIIDQVATAEALEQLLYAGKIRVGIFVPDDFERRRLDPSRPLAQLFVDGTDPVLQGIANRLSTISQGSTSVTARSAPAIAVRNYFNPEAARRSTPYPGSSA